MPLLWRTTPLRTFSRVERVDDGGCRKVAVRRVGRRRRYSAVSFLRRAFSPGLDGLECQPRDVGLEGVLGTLGALDGVELPVRVYLPLELGERASRPGWVRAVRSSVCAHDSLERCGPQFPLGGSEAAWQRWRSSVRRTRCALI